MEQDKLTFPAVSFDEFVPTTYETWKKEVVDSLKGADFDKKLTTKTYEGITLQPIYTQADVDVRNLGATFPGYQDYLRGVTAGGYLEKPWEVAQGVSECCPQKANALIREELAKGATCVNVKIGNQGIAVKSAADMQKLLNGISFTKTAVHINCGFSALETLGWMAKMQDCLHDVKGMVGADPIGRLVACGSMPKTLDELYNELAESVKLAAQKAPGLRTVLVDGNVYVNGGASAVQEISCCMATAAAYIEALMDRGVDINTAARAIRFSFGMGANFFMEISKLRAARVVFAQMVAAFGGDAEAQKLNVLTHTSSFTKTLCDPYVNILRATTETFASVVGGTDAMEIATLDEAYGSSDEQTRRIARNMQVMMREEFGLIQPVDPAGGSWYIESLTADLAKAVWSAFQKLEAEGGIVKALEAGTVQAEIAKVLSERFKKLATRTDHAVGINMYANMLEKRLVRPETAVMNSCEDCAVKSTIQPIVAHRWTEQFEALRARTEEYESKTGKTIKIFLANMGPIPQHKARAEFACGFFEVAHFEMLRNDGFATVEEAAAAAAASGASVTVICSTDATYPELVPPLAKLIKKKCPDMAVMLAGAPAPEYKDSYVSAGVDEFIHVRANCYDVLSKIQSARGIC